MLNIRQINLWVRLMQRNRWYDRNENLRKIIEYIKEQDDLDSIALDIIQLMFQKQQDKDDFLEEIGKDITGKRERWYDNDYMFYSAIEMLKFLPDEAAERILRESVSYWDIETRTEDYEDFHRH